MRGGPRLVGRITVPADSLFPAAGSQRRKRDGGGVPPPRQVCVSSPELIRRPGSAVGNAIPVCPPRPGQALRSARNGARCWWRRRRARIYQAVVAALHARMILVARDQKDHMLISVGEQTVGDDLSAVVDGACLSNVNTSIGRYKCIQVYDGAVLP